MNTLKRIFKNNSHNTLFKHMAGIGRSINRLYENRNHDPYSNGEFALIKKLQSIQPKIVIDGGANIGNYSLYFANQHQNCKIYAFEPVKSTFDEMKNRVKPYNNIIPINKGLYSKICSKEIFLHKSNTHSSLFDLKGVSNHSTQISKIDLINGDSFAKNNDIDSIDFIKLDIEGAEYDAILGLEDLLTKRRIKAIQFEYGYINISTKKLLIDFYDLFAQYDYTLGKIFPKQVEFREYKSKHEDFIGPNFIAVNNNEKEFIRILEKRI